MFVLVIEKRLSVEIVKKEEHVDDWYVLLSCVLPFAPTVGTELQLKSGEFGILTRVVYSPKTGTFWAQVKDVLHIKDDVETGANRLVEHFGWDRAVAAPYLQDVRAALAKEGVRKLQQMIAQAQTEQRIAVPTVIRGPSGRNLNLRG